MGKDKENKEVFRKKNLEKINSPEDMTSYLRITNPSIIVTLSAVGLLLAGAIVWGTTAKIEAKAKGVAIRDGELSYSLISENDIGSVKVNSTKMRANNEEYIITGYDTTKYASSVLPEDVRILAGFNKDSYFYVLDVDKPINPGVYASEYVLKVYTPFQFLFGKS